MGRHDKAESRSRGGLRFVVTIGCVISVLSGPTVAGASEATDADRLSDVRRSSAQIDIPQPASSSREMWTWSKGRRGYMLLKGKTASLFGDIASLDLDTGRMLARETLTRPAYSNPTYTNSQVAANTLTVDASVAVDEEGGRLFVATEDPPLPLPIPFNPNAQSQDAVRRATGPAAGRTCLHNGSGDTCVTGVSVVDAETLEHLRHIPLAQVRVDGGALSPQLLSMRYAPAEDGLPAKLHLLLLDSTTAASTFDVAAALSNPKNYRAFIYLVQLDPDSGQQDWSLRLDDCGGVRHGTSKDGLSAVAAMGQSAAILRENWLGSPAVYVGCVAQSTTLGGVVVRVPLDESSDLAGEAVGGIALPPLRAPSGEDSAPTAETEPGERVRAVYGPDRVYRFAADPVSGRLLLQVLDGKPMAEVWWAFDTKLMQFIGTIGIGGPVTLFSSMSTVQDGRLYVLAAATQVSGKSFEGGLYVADLGTNPLAQALAFPEMAEAYPRDFIVDGGFLDARWQLVGETLPDGGVRVWYPNAIEWVTHSAFVAIEDHRPPLIEQAVDDFAGRTLDLDEVEGVTASSVDGAARGYGVRALLVGGAEAAARLGPVDPIGTVEQCNDPRLDFGVANFGIPGPCTLPSVSTPVTSACLHGDREVVLAAVGPGSPAVLDGSGGRGAAEPLTVDSLTTADSEAPVSRCTGKDWDQLWGSALFGQAPVAEPTGAERESTRVECVHGAPQDSASTGDPVVHGLAARVACEEQGTSGYAYARGVSVAELQVAEAFSSFRIYRDPVRGVVSRVESVARGLTLPGYLHIDTVRGVAESWANGRRQLVPVEARADDYDANCDMERTAGTCFQRHLFGVRSSGYSCGPCGDEHAFVDGMNRAFNPHVAVRLREPEPRLRGGAENGFTAAIQKAESERFSDLVLNNDLQQTTLPTLEIIRYAPPNRVLSRMGARGRQIYQFAGVEVSSSYGISCLLVYDEAANTCGLPAEAPGSIQVSLSDTDGKPLAGGAFEVRADVDADGVLGLKDTLLPDGACVTAEDGIGTCLFENLQPGTYLVSQVAAPPGYAKTAEPWVSQVASGEQRTVAFTNVSNVSTIDLTATDENGAPISGATFAAYADPDSDGKVAPDAQPAAECTTDAQGTCTMKVPAGSYVLVQTSAPGGLEGIEPVPFTFASGGQVASVTVVNYPPASPEQPAPAAAPVYTSPVDMAPPREFIDDGYVAAPVDAIAPDVAPAPSVTERVGGTVTQVIRAPGDALRLLARDPKQAVAWTAALALFAVAVLLVRRRGLLTALADNA